MEPDNPKLTKRVAKIWGKNLCSTHRNLKRYMFSNAKRSKCKVTL